MSERIKLANPGEELTMTVATIELDQIENTAYFKFDSGTQELLVPTASVTRQFDRLGVSDGHQLAGKTIKFSRSEKVNQYGKPYWNLDLATGSTLGEAVKAALTPSKPKPAKPPIPSHANVPNKDLPEFLREAEAQDNASLAARVGVDLTGIQSKLAVYQGITEWYLKNIPPLYDAAKIGCSPESAAAGIHTLFITANK